MRTLPWLLSTLLLLSHALALAEPTVPVLWKVRYEIPGAADQYSVPPVSYLARITACGIHPALNGGAEEVPLSALRCPGLLDFSQNSALKKRLSGLIGQVLANAELPAGIPSSAAFRSRLEQVDFAISPYGVFFSASERPGSPRYAAVNVAQQRLVILNQAFWKGISKARDLDPFLVHEALEAAGMDDTDFAISSAVTAAHHEKPGAAKGKTKIAMGDGGASVLPRGGDPNQMMFKAQLRLLAGKKLQVEGVASADLPSRQQLLALIEATPVTVAPLKFVQDHGLCQGPNGEPEQLSYCGAFVLHGSTGKPFLLISDQWGGLPDQERLQLAIKIFQQMVSELYRERMGR